MRLPRAPLGAAAFDPNKGIKITPKLLASDIGNVLDPTTRKSTKGSPIVAGTVGTLNTDTTLFGTDGHPQDPHNANDALNPYKPSQGEIGGDTTTNPPGGPPAPYVKPLGDRGGLAEMFGVGVRTVERWFYMYDKRGRREAANWVPVASLGKRPGQLPDYKLDAQGRSVIYTFTRKDQNGNTINNPDGTPQIFTLPQFGSKMRVFTAAALCVDGGLQRIPIYTKGGGQGANIPYELRIEVGTIAEAARSMYAVYTGLYDDLGDVPLSKAWIQMTIEPVGDGWDLVVLLFFPYPWEYDNADNFEDDPTP